MGDILAMERATCLAPEHLYTYRLAERTEEALLKDYSQDEDIGDNVPPAPMRLLFYTTYPAAFFI